MKKVKAGTVERKKMIGDEVFVVAKTASGSGVISIHNDSSSKRRIELCTVTDDLRPYPSQFFLNAFVTRHSHPHHLLKGRFRFRFRLWVLATFMMKPCFFFAWKTCLSIFAFLWFNNVTWFTYATICKKRCSLDHLQMHFPSPNLPLQFSFHCSSLRLQPLSTCITCSNSAVTKEVHIISLMYIWVYVCGSGSNLLTCMITHEWHGLRPLVPSNSNY